MLLFTTLLNNFPPTSCPLVNLESFVTLLKNAAYSSLPIKKCTKKYSPLPHYDSQLPVCILLKNAFRIFACQIYNSYFHPFTMPFPTRELELAILYKIFFENI